MEVFYKNNLREKIAKTVQLNKKSTKNGLFKLRRLPSSKKLSEKTTKLDAKVIKQNIETNNIANINLKSKMYFTFFKQFFSIK